MACKHNVWDTDNHFSISAITRAITNVSPMKTLLMQYDHDSERFTFEMPRYVEGHDMMLCNRVEIHYINIGSNKEQNAGLYAVSDMQISPDSETETVVIFSWLISQNATKLAGSLHFLIRFVCIGDDDVVNYAWNTDIYKGISISNGISNTDIAVEDCTDILNEWDQRILTLENRSIWQELVEVENRFGLFHKSVYYPNTQGVYTQYVTKIYDIRNCTKVRINGTSSGGADAYHLLDANKLPTGHSIERNITMTDKVLDTNDAAFLAISSKWGDFWEDTGIRVDGFCPVNKNPWRGSKIVWYGTSIPQGGKRFAYPMQVGRILDANVTNLAVGSSSVHARVYSLISDTNPYGFDPNFGRSSRALGNTVEQMQWIANWIDYKINGGTYQNAEAWDDNVFLYSLPTTWTADDTATILDYSYEVRLDRYLTDDLFPDLFVFDHGYNDKMSTSDDLGLYESMFETEGRHNLFTFRGTMNFLIDRILTFNPHARIYLIGNYDKTLAEKDTIYKYQLEVADEYQFPLLPMWEKLGLSQITVTVDGAWNNGTWQKTTSGALPFTLMKTHLPDGVHPHSDKSGGMNRKMARIIAEWMKLQS